MIREAPAGTDPQRFLIGLKGNVQVLDLTSRRESERLQSNPSLTYVPSVVDVVAPVTSERDVRARPTPIGIVPIVNGTTLSR